MSRGSRGHTRERQVRKHLEEQGWWVCRAAGSLGDADLVALRVLKSKGRRLLIERVAWLVEVKSNTDGGPYKNFMPAERRELAEAAKLAGAEAWLCYWPPRKPIRFIHESEWPA